ncbi:hypothetical protein [Paraburkholderia hospita]|uniref:hypothetical protein n=1 Tax=Paraburkholderia hospita TaxID=169430 RepID=UPI00117818D7|nr:hypothetical protein [Paraburkholderia hospita]
MIFLLFLVVFAEVDCCAAGLFFCFCDGIRVFACGAVVWFACVFAGIRVTVFAIQASPLCGAAPTFLCRRKEK